MRITVWLRDIRHRICIDFEIGNLTHERRSARGHTILATTDLDHTLLLETPVEIRRRIGC